MNRYKTLLNNTLVFFVSEFASKILVFLLLPLYTSYLTTEQFGTADLIATTVNLLLPIFTLCIAQAGLRFAMDKEADKRQVFSFGIFVIMAGFLFLLAAYPLLRNIKEIEEYLGLFYLLYITNSIDTYLSYFSRAINQLVLVGVTGVVKTVSMIGFNLVFIVLFRWGITGYIFASVLSYAISSSVLFWGGDLKKFITFTKIETLCKTEMLKYSIPLVPNSLSWWLSNYASRYIILLFCGVGVQGMFAVASKIPVVLTTVQTIFSKAWQLSAISEYDKPQRDEFYSRIYKLYNVGMVLCTAILIFLVRIIALILFSGEFYSAWVYVPFLLISVIFGALSGFLGTFFAASKRNATMFTTTLIGGISAVAFNFILVPFAGPVGASIATVAANMIVWLMRLIKSRNYVNLNAELSLSWFCYCLLFVQATSIIVLKDWPGYIGAGLAFMVIMAVNYEYIRYLLQLALVAIKGKRK